MARRSIGAYFLDVGQGDATVVLPPEGEGGAVVFDCRDDFVVTRLLESWGCRHISALIVSHLDWDHIAGVRQLLQHPDLEVGVVHLNVDRDITDDHPNAKRAKAMLDEALQGRAERRWELVETRRDPRPVLQGGDWSIDLLAPEAALTIGGDRDGSWEDPNRYSAVLRVTMQERRVLVGADAPLATWAELEDEERAATVFRNPHHGGALDDGEVPEGWGVADLYESVGADTVAVSVGTNNGYGHPSPQWVEPISGGACRMLCTQVTERCHPGVRARASDHLNAVLEQSFLVEPEWRHGRDRRRRRSGTPEVPCAGTIVVNLYEDGEVRVRPRRRGHDRVVALWSDPLCQARV